MMLGMPWNAGNADVAAFLCGLSFSLVGLMCLLALPSRTGPINWRWMGAFALLQAAAEWTVLWTNPDEPAIPAAVIRLAFLSASFLSLAEFGRRGLSAMSIRTPKPWFHLLLIPFVGLVAFVGGWAGAESGIRLAFGFTGALWAGLAVHLAAAGQGASRTALRWTARPLFLLAIASGVIGPASSALHGRLCNEDLWLFWTGLPVEAVRAGLALALATTLAAAPLSSELRGADRVSVDWRRAVQPGWLVLLVLAAAGGWMTSREAGRREAGVQRDRVLALLKVSASAFVRDGMAPDSAGSADPDRELLLAQARAMPGARRLYLLERGGDGVALFRAESRQKDEPALYASGDEFTFRTTGLAEAFQTGRGGFADFFEDGAGAPCVRAFAPVPPAAAGEPVSRLLAADMRADDIRLGIAAARRPPLVISSLFYLLLSAAWLHACRAAAVVRARRVAPVNHALPVVNPVGLRTSAE